MRRHLIRSAATLSAVVALSVCCAGVSPAEPLGVVERAQALADFNGDGVADLAIGVPFEDQTGTDDGAVNVIYGSGTGLNQAGNQVWDQDSPSIIGTREANDRLGSSLAAG